MDNWSVLLTFTYPHEAHLAKGYLESEGIETIIQDELTAQVNNFYSNAIGGVKLLVRNGDLERGVEVLKAGGYIVEQGAAEPEIVWVEDVADKGRCPFCHSENIGRKQNLKLLAVIVYFILSVLFPLFRCSYKCYDCGKEWKYKK